MLILGGEYRGDRWWKADTFWVTRIFLAQFTCTMYAGEFQVFLYILTTGQSNCNFSLLHAWLTCVIKNYHKDSFNTRMRIVSITFSKNDCANLKCNAFCVLCFALYQLRCMESQFLSALQTFVLFLWFHKCSEEHIAVPPKHITHICQIWWCGASVSSHEAP